VLLAINLLQAWGRRRNAGGSLMGAALPAALAATPPDPDTTLAALVVAGSSSRCRWRPAVLLAHSRPCSPWRSPRAAGLPDSFADRIRRRVRLTLHHGARVVPINTVFGLAAAWAIAKFEFRARASSSRSSTCRWRSRRDFGMIFVLLFGLHGWFGVCCASTTSASSSLCRHMLATMFVTFPYVAPS